MKSKLQVLDHLLHWYGYEQRHKGSRESQDPFAQQTSLNAPICRVTFKMLSAKMTLTQWKLKLLELTTVTTALQGQSRHALDHLTQAAFELQLAQKKALSKHVPVWYKFSGASGKSTAIERIK